MFIKTIDDLQNAPNKDVDGALASITPFADLDDYLVSLNDRKLRMKTSRIPCRENCVGNTIIVPPRSTCCIHPSSISRCTRQIAYELMGFEDKVDGNVGARLRRLFDLGTKVHEQLQGYLHAMYPEHVLTELEAEDPVLPIFGSTDVLLEWPDYGGRVLFEIKSINDKGFKALGPAPKSDHMEQGTVYQALNDAPFLVTWYYNKNDSSMREYVQTFNFELWERIEERVLEILSYIKLHTFPPRTVSTFNCRDCKFDPLCKAGTLDPLL